MIMKRIAQAGWILTWLAVWVMAAGAAPTITKRLIYKEDTSPGFGAVTVPTSTGGTMTVHKLNYSNLAGPFFDIREYGAVGDDNTDSATAIDNAMNACGDAGGGTLFAVEGIYLLGTVSSRAGSGGASYVVPRSNCNVVGVGDSTVFKVKSGEAARLDDSCAGNCNPGPRIFNTTARVDNAIYRDFKLDYNGEGNLMDNTMKVRGYVGIGIEGGGKNWWIINVAHQSNPGNGCIAVSGPVGLADTGNLNVIGNRFYEMGSGLTGNYNMDHTDIYLVGKGVRVLYNDHVSTNKVNGSPFDDSADDVLYQGNYTYNYDMGFGWVTSYYNHTKYRAYINNRAVNARVMLGFSDLAASVHTQGTLILRDNYFALHPTASAVTPEIIYGDSELTAAHEELIIEGNTFYGVPGIAMGVFRPLFAKNIYFRNNRAYNFDHGVILSAGDALGDGYSHHIVDISGNTFDNVANIGIYQAGGLNKSLVITNNTITTTAGNDDTAISLGASADSGRITGNTIDNNFLLDIASVTGLENVFIDHHTRSTYAMAGTVIANGAGGSIIRNDTLKLVLEKINGKTDWKRTYTDNTTSGKFCNTGERAGDIVINNGLGVATDNTALWYCNGSAWVAK